MKEFDAEFEIDEDGVICEKNLQEDIVGSLMRAGAVASAVDYMEVFFSKLLKKIARAFDKDASFLQWERAVVRSFASPQTTPFKILGIFAEKVSMGTKAYLLEDLTGAEMQSLIKEIVYAKVMLHRWLFVGYSLERRERALVLTQCTTLRRALEQCSELPGFTGNVF